MVDTSGAKGELAHRQNRAQSIVDPRPPPPDSALVQPRRPWTLLDLIALVGAIVLLAAGRESGLVILYFWFRERKKTGWQ